MTTDRRIALLCLLALPMLNGCIADMWYRAKYKPMEPNSVFSNHNSSRSLVAGTVARGKGDIDSAFYSGRDSTAASKLVTQFPVPVTESLLDRGQERFNIYCTPCHGRTGEGNGIVVQRGFTPPPSYYSPRLMASPIGHFFDVITNGWGVMYSYSDRVEPRDRWAIAAYIRVLQRSHTGKPDDVPAGQQSGANERNNPVTISQDIDRRVIRMRNLALGVGIVSAILCIVPARAMPASFFHAYLYAYIFWLDIALGSFGVVMIHIITGGEWGFPIRRLMEAATMTLPLMAVLFVPLLFGLQYLYPWSRPAAIAASRILQHRHVLYTESWFVSRCILYFAVWIGMAVTLRRWSLAEDRTGDIKYSARFQAAAGPALVLYTLTVSAAAIDWLMAIEPEWYSTIFGLLVIVGQGLTALAWGILCARIIAGSRIMREIAPESGWHDLGGMTCACVLMWAYMAYSQYIIIWSGDIPRETSFFVHRREGGWGAVALLMLILHFFLPFFLLLFGRLKKNTLPLTLIALIVLFAQLVNDFWTVEPTFHSSSITVTWLDVLLPAAMGGFWIAVLAGAIRGMSLLPLHDPRLAGSSDAANALEALSSG